MKHRITVENCQDKTSPFRGYKSALRRAVTATLEREGFLHRAQIDVTLVSAEEIQALNRIHRGVDRPTDVLSFPMSEKGDWQVEQGSVLLGDVIVCPEVIRRQAAEFQNSYRSEFCLMVIHSTLHLLGWDHKKTKEKEKMFALQEEILSSLGEGEIKTESKRIGE